MPRTKGSSNSMENSGLPQWIEDEIRSIEFLESDVLTRTGYILDIYQNDFKLDIQLYEALPDGRTIIEGIDVPKSYDFSKFMKGFVYEFKIGMSRGKLGNKTTEFLKRQYSLDMDSIYHFKLIDLQLMDLEVEQSNSELTDELIDT